MNLLIVGATRGIGFELLRQALEQEQEVTVLARSPHLLPIQPQRVKIVRGDIRDAAPVDDAMAGQEAVCCSIGINITWKPVTVFSDGTRNLLQAMRKHGVKRLICVTGIGAGDSKGHGGFVYDRIVNPLLLRSIYADKDRQEALIKTSNVDWTIVRPGFLTDGPLTKRYRALTDLAGVTAGKISRADVAHFILGQLNSRDCVKQTPLLTY
ncbi:MAG: NAD(P)-dependent oxidoreductase [Chromatiales bacterium]